MLRLQAFPAIQEQDTLSYRIGSRVRRTPTELRISFQVEAQNPEAFSKIQFPQANASPERKGELWLYTCFECFIPSRNGEAYLEFNGSPSGDWNWFSFQSYRKGMKEFPLSPECYPKQVAHHRSDTGLEDEWVLPMEGIQQGFISAGLNDFQLEQIGIATVLRTSSATTYWALTHGGEQPDFHRRSSWSATL